MTTVVYEGFNSSIWPNSNCTNLLGSSAWLQAMMSRLPGKPITVASDNLVYFVGTIVDEPSSYEAYNPLAILWRPDPVFPLPRPELRSARLALLAQAAGSVLPALVLVAPGYHGDPIVSCPDDTDSIHTCLAELLQWCAVQGLLSLHILYCESQHVQRAVARLGGAEYFLTHRARLPVWWNDWSSYLTGILGRRRRHLERELREASSHLKLSEVCPKAFQDDLLAGRCALLARYGQPYNLEGERSRLHALHDSFGSSVRAFGGVKNGNLVCGCLGLQFLDGLYILYSTMTPEGEEIPFAHFSGTFYAVINSVHTSGLSFIDYGIGHEWGKQQRGCNLIPLRGYSIAINEIDKPNLVAAADALNQAC